LWWAKSQNFDLVHAFETRPTTLIPARLLQRKGAVFFSDWADWLGKGGSVEERPAGIRKGLLRILETWYENRKFHNSDGLTAICSILVDEARKRGYSPEKILLLPNGMRNPHLKPIPISQARMEKGLPMESVIIGYIGSGFRSDMELMYSAFSLLQDKPKNVKLLHVGRSNYFAPRNDDIICTGDVSDQDASVYLSACDFFWFPLRNTNANRGRLPLKFSDYLTIGRPIVSTNVGDLATWVRRLEVGLVGDDDAQSISRMVVELINSQNLRKAMSRNAIQASESHELSWEARATELEYFYFSRMQAIRESENFGNDDL
jgi:glycosyltransferase involved in cell wall biosynthesis